MTALLEHALARLSLKALDGIGGLWRPCTRCASTRWRWHRHEQLPLAVVLELSRGGRRDGGDVA